MTITIEQTRKRAEADAKTNGSFLVNDPPELVARTFGRSENQRRSIRLSFMSMQAGFRKLGL